MINDISVVGIVNSTSNDILDDIYSVTLKISESTLYGFAVDTCLIALFVIFIVLFLLRRW